PGWCRAAAGLATSVKPPAITPRPAPARRHRSSGATRDVHRAVFRNICTLTPHSPDRLCAISDSAQSSLGRIEKPGISVYVFDLQIDQRPRMGLTARAREAHLGALPAALASS